PADDTTGLGRLIGTGHAVAAQGPNNANWQATVNVDLEHLQLFPTKYYLYGIVNEQPDLRPDAQVPYRTAPLRPTNSGAFPVDYGVHGTVSNQDGAVQAGWTVFLDLNQNGVRDPGEPAQTTNDEGFYGFYASAIPPGTQQFDVRLIPLAEDFDLPDSPQ